MAQQKPSTQKVDEQAQSDHIQDNSNPQLLNSEMAKAFQELAQGEQTASAIEAKLDGIHKNLDQLLASFEDIAADSHQQKDSATDTSTSNSK